MRRDRGRQLGDTLLEVIQEHGPHTALGNPAENPVRADVKI